MIKAELEKENAELKKMYHKSDEDNNKLRENIPLLAEAKEIIKTLAVDLSMYSGNYQKELLEAKKFLSEVEK